MKIAILGAKDVGRTLGKRFAEIGHDVRYGVRHPDAAEYSDLKPIGTVAESASEAEMIVLAIPFDACESALSECGDLAGKIIVDATNPFAMGERGLTLKLGFDTSAAEQIAKFTGDGKLVKCFNSTGWGNMLNPRGSMMFVCGNDAEANETVRKLAEDIGFDALNIGDITRARILEPLAELWVHLAFTTSLGRNFAFSISRTDNTDHSSIQQ